MKVSASQTWAIIFLFLIPLLFSCNPAQKNANTEQDLLEKARMEFIAAMNANDIDAIMDFLSSGHVTMAPNEPAYYDNDKLRQWHEYRVEHFNTNFKFDILSTKYSEKYAIDYWMLTTDSFSITENESTMGDNKGIWVWERQEDGQWKLLWSIWNENIPAHPIEE